MEKQKKAERAAGSTRRAFLRAGALAAAGSAIAVLASASSGSARTAAERGSVPAFVLVHGAWHGGWCWKRTTPYLRAAGHNTYPITLTGLGARSHLARPDIDLDLHIRDVVSVIETEELSNVILVGHSYGGMVVTGVADRVPSRIRRMVYLDAFVPADGKCLFDYLPPERAAGLRKEGEASGTMACGPVQRFGVTKGDDVRWVESHLSRQPYRTFTQPIALKTDAAKAAVRKTYVYCSSPAIGSFDRFATRFRSDRSGSSSILRPGTTAWSRTRRAWRRY